MKASKLLKQLIKLSKVHGDLEIHSEYDSGCITYTKEVIMEMEWCDKLQRKVPIFVIKER